MTNNIIDDGELAIQTMPLPAEGNLNGEVFGGWIFSQMDLAGGIVAGHFAKARVVSVAVNNMIFKKTIGFGDTVSIYAKLIKKGRTSMTYKINAYVRKRFEDSFELASTAEFVFVKVCENGIPKAI